jgi:hypothetical protein
MILSTNNHDLFSIIVKQNKYFVQFKVDANGLGYEYLLALALNFANTHQTENQLGFSEVGEKKQLLITIVGNNFMHFKFHLEKI